MKRGLLIAGGALGGLGAVMAITPPQFSSTESLALGAPAMGSSTPAAKVATASATPTATDSPTPVATKTQASTKVTKKATPSKSATPAATASSNSNSGAVATADPTPTATKTTAAPAPASKGVTGTFTGPTVNVNYGNVQVQITVKDGKIIDATALQAPSGRNDRWTNMALPILKKQTLAAQSASIQGASGASYTSYGWYTSLQGALAKAGL
jgi:uncharacterized protein with FMN-binding domain